LNVDPHPYHAFSTYTILTRIYQGMLTSKRGPPPWPQGSVFGGRSVAVPDRLSDHHDHPKFTVDHLGKQIWYILRITNLKCSPILGLRPIVTFFRSIKIICPAHHYRAVVGLRAFCKGQRSNSSNRLSQLKDQKSWGSCSWLCLKIGYPQL
jgi:hypothetical protein